MKTINLVNIKNSEIKYKIHRFPDGQQNITIDKIDVLRTIAGEPVKDYFERIQIKSRLNNFLDLELIICTVASLKELGVEEIHLYVPYFLGSRSDRKFEEGSNNYLKTVICPIINSLNLDSVTVLDPHSDVLEGCLNKFKKESNELLVRFALENLYQPEKDKSFSLDQCILVSPDAGASKKIYKLVEQIGYKGDIIICSKDRDKDGKLTKINVPHGQIHNNANKDIIIIDDICDGGATFINIARFIKENYGSIFNGKIYLIVTHGIFSKGFDELSRYFDGIYTTDSYGTLEANVESGKGKLVDSWIGSTEDQYYSEIPKDFIKQLKLF